MARYDDQVQREKRTIDILCVAAARYDEKEETSGEVATVEDKEKQRTRRVINYGIRSTRSSGSSKRQKIDECDESQNPNRDASSPRLCPVESKRRRHVGVSSKGVRRKKPVRRRETVRRRRPGPERGRTPEWLVNLMREKNGKNVKLIKKRVLTKTDLTSSQTRLLIPWNGISDMDFLNEGELKIVDEHYNKLRDTGVDFTLVDSKGREWDLNIRRWDMTKSPNYALCTGWNKVVANNEFVVDQTLWIWSFHSLDKLYIAFVPLDSALALPPVPDPAPSLHPAPVVTGDSGQNSSAM
ncbi:B3 domain-containing protein [Cardamine amara subsp. amara]|uniref:B3 domain-containing protein n=1 Tax=Cardamine amara subsp. amara TaxID=228776 RepID=A0ABD1BVI2_CARAN